MQAGDTREATVGASIMAHEHVELLALNGLCIDAERDGLPHHRLTELVDATVAAVERHFAHELAEMERVGYPRTLSHANAHREASATLQDMLASGPGVALPAGIGKYLLRWFLAHTRTEDRDYDIWLARRG